MKIQCGACLRTRVLKERLVVRRPNPRLLQASTNMEGLEACLGMPPLPLDFAGLNLASSPLCPPSTAQLWTWNSQNTLSPTMLVP